MNLLFLFKSPLIPELGGVERVSYLLAKEFSKLGHNIIFLSMENNKNISLSDDFPFQQLYINSNDPVLQKDIFNRILEDNKIDIIINQFLNDSSLSLLQSVENNSIKIISVYHNQPFAYADYVKTFKKLTHPTTLKGLFVKQLGFLFPKFYLRKRNEFTLKLFKDFLNSSDKLMLLSGQYKTRLSRFISDSDKIDALPNPNTFKVSKENYKSVEKYKEKLILFVGRLEDPQKNVKDFIDVWKLFSKDHPDWQAMILGSGPHENIFRKYANKRKVKNLEFKGNQNNIQDFYKRARFICMTSLYEGWPMVLPEAISYGCIPVAYDTFEALKEITDNGKAGIIITPFNKEEMANSLSKLAADENSRKMIIEKGLEHIANFEASIIASEWQKKLLDLFQK